MPNSRPVSASPAEVMADPDYSEDDPVAEEEEVGTILKGVEPILKGAEPIEEELGLSEGHYFPHSDYSTPIIRESAACARLARLVLESLCAVGRGYPCSSEEPKQERETRENSYKSDLQTC